MFSDGEKGITATKLNNVIALAQIQTAFYNAKPTTSTLDPTDMLLTLKSSGSYAQVSGTNLAASISAGTFGASRLRSFNAVQNPNFEVDQISVAGLVNVVPGGGKFIDRWYTDLNGTARVSSQQIWGVTPDVPLPGTNFRISRCYYRITLTTAQASLGTNDQICLRQQVEGPNWRELSNDVTSVTLLVRSSVAGLKFGFSFRDPPGSTVSLTKLCTIPAANTWTLITLPNLPLPGSGNFTGVPGSVGFQINLTLAAGSALTSAANDAWQTANVIGAIGQDNYASKPVNSTFDVGFVQLEPGGNCTTLMDKPFSQNLDECLRYYCKSQVYTSKFPDTGGWHTIGVSSPSSTNVRCYEVFPVRMAKPPTVNLCGTNGTQGQVFLDATAANVAITGATTATDTAIQQFVLASAAPATPAYQSTVLAGWQADTGW